ncbi:MAG TPA: hypothetical protein P5319_08880 [Gemmatimonadales bacterium]|nr:hypothetical protein [Gemmatimonadales bacterium]
MHRALRWLRNTIAAVVVLLLVAVATLYALSERIMRRTYEEPLVSVPIPTDSASIAEGERLSSIHGCRGCHAASLAGQWFEDDFWLGHIAAPNLTEAARTYSDPELVRIIRRGVRPDGRSVVVMSSDMFAPLSDTDLGKIIAYIRSVPPVAGLSRAVKLGPLARLGLVIRQYDPSAVLVRQADSVTASGYFPASGDPGAKGAYLARTACVECHGVRLEGSDFAPDLRIAAGYTREQFAHFFQTGEALGGRDLPLMSQVARSRFSHLTDEEEDALFAYLIARAVTHPISGSTP